MLCRECRENNRALVLFADICICYLLQHCRLKVCQAALAAMASRPFRVFIVKDKFLAETIE